MLDRNLGAIAFIYVSMGIKKDAKKRPVDHRIDESVLYINLVV